MGRPVSISYPSLRSNISPRMNIVPGTHATVFQNGDAITPSFARTIARSRKDCHPFPTHICTISSWIDTICKKLASIFPSHSSASAFFFFVSPPSQGSPSSRAFYFKAKRSLWIQAAALCGVGCFPVLVIAIKRLTMVGRSTPIILETLQVNGMVVFLYVNAVPIGFNSSCMYVTECNISLCTAHPRRSPIYTPCPSPPPSSACMHCCRVLFVLTARCVHDGRSLDLVRSDFDRPRRCNRVFFGYQL